MALPKTSHKLYNLTIPSTQEQIKFRAYLTKDQNFLLMALESKEESEIIDALKQVITNCIVTPENFDVDKYPLFDLEYIFINIRGKSSGEMIPVRILCNRIIDGVKCNHVMDAALNTNDVKITLPKEDMTVIKLDNGLGVKMKYPNFEFLKRLSELESNTKFLFDSICDHIAFIFDQENTYTNFTRLEIEEWIGELTGTEYSKLSSFLENVPQLSHTIKVICDKCGHEGNLTITGVSNFFQ